MGGEGSAEIAVVLDIGTTSSKCGACRRNADPDETTHIMEFMRGEGCGATFTHVTTGYVDAMDRVKAMRPDLTFIGWQISLSPASCPTCGPVQPEPHPCRQGVTRCSNCKEWLTTPPASTPEEGL